MIRKINPVLKHTHSTIDEIYEQYYEDADSSEVIDKILYVVNSLDVFEQNVFYLYCEYNSLRKVADETNVSRTTVLNIINKVRDLIQNCSIDNFSNFYILKDRL